MKTDIRQIAERQRGLRDVLDLSVSECAGACGISGAGTCGYCKVYTGRKVAILQDLHP
jgi:hypothetical protein